MSEDRNPYREGWLASIRDKYDNAYPIESEDWRKYAMGFADATIAILGGWWRRQDD